MKIGIDIDGVLTNFYEELITNGIKFCYKNNINYCIKPDEYQESKVLGISEEDIEHFWNYYLGEYVQHCKIRDGASEIISKLKKSNEIYIITSRNEDGLSEDLYGTMQEMTKVWLKKNGVEYDKIIFTQEKLKTCIENDIALMIEDCAENIQKLSDRIRVLCFDAPYNKKTKGKNVTRVYSWFDIMKKIEKKC